MLDMEYGPVPNYRTPALIPTIDPPAGVATGVSLPTDLFPPPELHQSYGPLTMMFIASMNSLRKWTEPPVPYPAPQSDGERAVNDLFLAFIRAWGDERDRIRSALDEVCGLAGLDRINVSERLGYGRRPTLPVEAHVAESLQPTS